MLSKLTFLTISLVLSVLSPAFEQMTVASSKHPNLVNYSINKYYSGVLLANVSIATTQPSDPNDPGGSGRVN